MYSWRIWGDFLFCVEVIILCLVEDFKGNVLVYLVGFVFVYVMLLLLFLW